MDFDIKIAVEAYSHVSKGKTMTWEQMNELKYHNYGLFGLFREWLFGEGSMTARQMSEFLFAKTPDFLKEAFARYPYSSEKILSMTGKTRK